jgi:hypothetical protein
MSDDRDAITFPKAKSMPSFAIAFMDMMFAYAEFEEQVRVLQASIMKTTGQQPHVFARLQRFLNFGRETAGDLGNSRDRPKRMAKLITAHPGLVEAQEEKRIDQILKDAIALCDRRNHFAHGRVYRFYPNTSTIKVRGERRKGKPEWAAYTEGEINEIGCKLRSLALDLNDIKRAIERRRGDHDAPESDFESLTLAASSPRSHRSSGM